jgi:hypothetical protein
LGCSAYDDYDTVDDEFGKRCLSAYLYGKDGKTAKDLCCICGGGTTKND